MPSLEFERSLERKGYHWVAGVDEVGRGPLAGPVLAGAVVLPQGLPDVPDWLVDVNDSKKLTARQRNRCLEEIRSHALGIGVGIAHRDEIDAIGIGNATRRALYRALADLMRPPDYVLADYVPLFDPGVPYQTIKSGDGLSYSIAAASIVAKVTRDSLMEEADRNYPGYGFSRHKGYATPQHLRQLSDRGPCPMHRRSFAPLRTMPLFTMPGPDATEIMTEVSS